MFVVVVVWFCRSSSLDFLISAYLINLMHHFLLHWVTCFRGYLFVHTPVFFEKYLNFLCFSICSSFGRQLCQKCGWSGSEPYVQSHITEPLCFQAGAVKISQTIRRALRMRAQIRSQLNLNEPNLTFQWVNVQQYFKLNKFRKRFPQEM